MLTSNAEIIIESYNHKSYIKICSTLMLTKIAIKMNYLNYSLSLCNSAWDTNSPTQPQVRKETIIQFVTQKDSSGGGRKAQ